MIGVLGQKRKGLRYPTPADTKLLRDLEGHLEAVRSIREDLSQAIKKDPDLTEEFTQLQGTKVDTVRKAQEAAKEGAEANLASTRETIDRLQKEERAHQEELDLAAHRQAAAHLEADVPLPEPPLEPPVEVPPTPERTTRPIEERPLLFRKRAETRGQTPAPETTPYFKAVALILSTAHKQRAVLDVVSRYTHMKEAEAQVRRAALRAGVKWDEALPLSRARGDLLARVSNVHGAASRQMGRHRECTSIGNTWINFFILRGRRS